MRPAQRVCVENGRAVGIMLADGTAVDADPVVSAAVLRIACLELLGREHLPAVALAILEVARGSEPVFAVFLGVLGGPELELAFSRFHDPHVIFAACADGRAAQAVWLDTDDPAIAPAGRHTVFVGRLDDCANWLSLKCDQACPVHIVIVRKELATRAEEFVPGSSAHIEAQGAAWQLRYQRHTHNWQGGAAGWNWDPQLAPRIKLAQDLPIEHCHAVGHGVLRPSGVPTAMITVWHIAREIGKEENPC